MGRHRWMHRWHVGLEGAWGLNETGDNERRDSGPAGRHLTPTSNASDSAPLWDHGGRSWQGASGQSRRADGTKYIGSNMTVLVTAEDAGSSGHRGMLSVFITGGNNRSWSLGVESNRFAVRLSTNGSGASTLTAADTSGSPASPGPWVVVMTVTPSGSGVQVFLQVYNRTTLSVSHTASTTLGAPLFDADAPLRLGAFAGTSATDSYQERLDSSCIFSRWLPEFDRRLVFMFLENFGFGRLGYA